jgi:methionyl-tRNA formyltransferase
LRILRAHVAAPSAQGCAPGTLLGLAEDGVHVACGDGVLAVSELQRAGRRPVSARDFANAVRLDGTRFGA